MVRKRGNKWPEQWEKCPENWYWYQAIKNETDICAISLYNNFRNSDEMIKSAFKNASIMEEVENMEIPDEDPFKHLPE